AERRRENGGESTTTELTESTSTLSLVDNTSIHSTTTTPTITNDNVNSVNSTCNNNNNNNNNNNSNDDSDNKKEGKSEMETGDSSTANETVDLSKYHPALELLLRSAQLGYHYAQIYLAFWTIEQWFNVPKHIPQGFKWCKIAAKSDFAVAQCLLAHMYHHG